MSSTFAQRQCVWNSTASTISRVFQWSIVSVMGFDLLRLHFRLRRPFVLKPQTRHGPAGREVGRQHRPCLIDEKIRMFSLETNPSEIKLKRKFYRSRYFSRGEFGRLCLDACGGRPGHSRPLRMSPAPSRPGPTSEPSAGPNRKDSGLSAESAENQQCCQNRVHPRCAVVADAIKRERAGPKTPGLFIAILDRANLSRSESHA